MTKVVRGSAHYADDDTMVFIPYQRNNPENITWLPLATTSCGKIECTKKKVRMTITLNRQDRTSVYTQMLTIAGNLLARFLHDRVAARLYEMAETKLPCEVKVHKHPKGEGMCKEDEDEIPMFP